VTRTDPQDVRGGSPVGVALSGTEKALIDQIRQRRGLGEGRSTLLRAVILEWLEREAGYVDTARRPAAKVERKPGAAVRKPGAQGRQARG
jgi:hypothetical protein